MTSHQVQLDLARELVDDIELSRLGPEQLLLKALRLARLLEDGEAESWLRWEIAGYPNTAPARAIMVRFGRLQDQSATIGYWQPLAGVTGAASTMALELQSLRIPDVTFAPTSANPNEMVNGLGGVHVQTATKPVTDVLARRQVLATAVTNLASIRSKVMGAIHDFAVEHYHRLAFGTLAENIFGSFRAAVDAGLAAQAPDAIEKIPSIYARLAEGDAEAISQAMSTLRRLIKATADRLHSASDTPAVVDGHSYEIGTDKVLNRLNAYVALHTGSKTRRDRLRRGLHDIWDRASASTHADIEPLEARSLFLQAYLLLGEILSLRPAQGAA